MLRRCSPEKTDIRKDPMLVAGSMDHSHSHSHNSMMVESMMIARKYDGRKYDRWWMMDGTYTIDYHWSIYRYRGIYEYDECFIQDWSISCIVHRPAYTVHRTLYRTISKTCVWERWIAPLASSCLVLPIEVSTELLPTTHCPLPTTHYPLPPSLLSINLYLSFVSPVINPILQSSP